VAVAAAGAIPPLVDLLRGSSDVGRTIAADMLGSLAASNAANTAAVAGAGAIPPLGGAAERRKWCTTRTDRLEQNNDHNNNYTLDSS
jgi:hypothetical protein